ncbi:MAG: SDR family NAD(P)-dependent oxidoreductase, partial [Verrucomicrobiaceae bacterium]
MTEGRLAGKTAIVTGGAQGLGEAHVRALVAEGARVLCTDVLDHEGKALSEELGDNVRFHHLDVSKKADWLETISAAEAFLRIQRLLEVLGPIEVTEIPGQGVSATMEEI